MAYKPSEKQNQRLKEAVKNFNRVITELNKQYGSGDSAPVIPEKRSMTDIKKNVSNYNEFRRELAALNRINKAKASDIVEFTNVKMTRYDVRELKNNIRQANKQRAAFRDIIGYDETRTDTENLRERKMPDLKYLNKSQVEHIIESAASEALSKGQLERIKQLKENYKQGLRENFTKSQAKRMITMVNKMDDIKFANAYMNDELEDLTFIYGPEKGKAARVRNKLRTATK